MFLHPSLGIVNYRPAGRPVNWLGDTTNAFWTLVGVDIWHQVSFMVVLLLAGLVGPAARALRGGPDRGAGSIRAFLHVTLPLMRPVIVVTLLLRLIFAIRTYDLVYIMTRGGPGQATDLVSYFIYRQAFVSLDIGQAWAMAVILLLSSSRSPPGSTATCARSRPPECPTSGSISSTRSTRATSRR